MKQTYKGGLHFTVICCMNKCIINERYIPEHQHKLNIYDLQIYDFLALSRISPRVRVRVSVSIVYRIATGAIPGYGRFFFNRKKNRKIR